MAGIFITLLLLLLLVLLLILAVLQVRKQILAAFNKGTIKPRAAYIALEHEWMHLETLAYMLAQEQRRAFESSTPAAHGHVSHGKANMNGGVEADSSSEDNAPQHAQHETWSQNES